MPTDILLDEFFDLSLKDGDLVIGESTRQHQSLLLLCEKGEIREFPTRGVGLQSWINDDIQFGDLRAAIKREFERDGMTVLGVRTTGTKIETDAIYE